MNTHPVAAIRVNLGRSRRRLRRVVLWLLPSACVLLLAISPFIAAERRNDWNLRQMAREFDAISHPPGTARVAGVPRVEAVGNLMGVSNQCNYIVAEVRSYSGIRGQIKTFYSGQTLRSPVSGERKAVRVVFGPDPRAEDVGVGRLFWMDEANKWGLAEAAAATPNRYIVYYEDGHEPGCDLRCH